MKIPSWRDGFQWYCWVSHARTKTAKEYPLLAPYLMVACDRSAFFHVRAINGIESLISGQEGPLPFPDDWVQDLRMRYVAGEWDYAGRSQ